MDAGLLAYINDTFQLEVLFQAQGDDNLVHRRILQILFQIFDLSDAENVFVLEVLIEIVIKNTVDHISPLRVCLDPVDVCLRCGAEADDDDVLQIMSAAAGPLQEALDQKTLCQSGAHADDIKCSDKASRYVFYLHKKDIDEQKQNTAGIGLDQIFVFCRLILITLWFVKIKLCI